MVESHPEDRIVTYVLDDYRVSIYEDRFAQSDHPDYVAVYRPVDVDDVYDKAFIGFYEKDYDVVLGMIRNKASPQMLMDFLDL